MTKAELVAKVALAASVTQSVATEVINATFDVITDSLVAGDKLQILGFGTFETKDRAAREGRNPATGETIQIAASKVPSFKAADKLKKACNN